MPQFQLNGANDPAYLALDEFTRGYIEALFFTDSEQLCEESDRERNMPEVVINMTTMESRFHGGNEPGFNDIAPESLARIVKDCAAFQTEQVATLARAYAQGYDATQAGADFWFSRNGHGCGFWDRGLGDIGERLHKACQYQECYTSLGDDGKIYL